MTGSPTHLAVAELVLQARRDAGLAVPADEDLPFFRLGALGPLWGDFLPTHPDRGLVDPDSPITQVWAPIVKALADSGGTPGIASNLRDLGERLATLRSLVAKQDKFELLAQKDRLLGLRDLGNTIRAQVVTITGLRLTVATVIARKARPKPRESPATDWHVRDALHGHRPGRFWGTLRRKALDSGDPRLAAFAMGVPVGVATALAVNPFINGVVGGPHRTQWWRHRWVSGYVDTWVWGYYRTRNELRDLGRDIVFPPPGRVPLPPYPTWENVAGSDLHESIAVGGVSPDPILAAVAAGAAMPAFLPADLATLLVDTYIEVVGDPVPAGVDAAGVQGAYAMHWLTTWLASSGDVFGATPPDRIDEPDSCGDRPTWVAVDGSIAVGGITEAVPPISTPSPSVAEIASAIVAALLAVLSYVTGNVIAGSEALAAALALLDDATDPNWDDLRCTSGWLESYVERLHIGLRQLFTTTGLMPPYAAELAHNEIQFQSTFGQIIPPFAALGTCRSPSGSEETYPASTWQPGITPKSNWTQYPTEELEEPHQVSYTTGPWFPFHAVDGVRITATGPASTAPYTTDQVNPLGLSPDGTTTVLSAAEWESRMSNAEAQRSPSGAFGNAVDLAGLLIDSDPEAMPDWDLDGDRGLGWPAWVTQPGAASPGEVEREAP